MARRDISFKDALLLLLPSFFHRGRRRAKSSLLSAKKERSALAKNGDRGSSLRCQEKHLENESTAFVQIIRKDDKEKLHATREPNQVGEERE